MSLLDGKFLLNTKLLHRQVKVVVVGAGGSGSHLVAQLAVLHQSMIDLGHPAGLSVTVIDRDEVSEANVGRAKFYAADVGVNKAHIITHRVNMCFGLDWRALDMELTEDCKRHEVLDADLIVGCVDTRKSRRTIKAVINSPRARRGMMWLDLGNGEYDGQVVLGEGGVADWERLPCVTDLYPELLNEADDPVDAGPSCSRAEALMKQSAFVNAQCALHAVTMLATLFRFGEIDHHAIFFDVKKNRALPLACNPQAWARFGWEPKKPEVVKEDEEVALAA